MFQSIHVILKLNAQDDPIVQNIARVTVKVALLCNVEVVHRHNIRPDTLIIAIGGDGTMLEAMRCAARYDATALGVNLGRVGFLSDLNVEDPRYGTLEDVLTELLNGTRPYRVEERTALVTSVDGDLLACNEVSISPITSDTLIKYHLKVDGTSAGIHRANGILIATANGSTAYTLAVGGALMMPGLDAIQIVPVAPITMTSRPLVVSGNSVVTIEAYGRDLAVRADGQAIRNPSDVAPWVIDIRRYLHPAKVLHLREWNYFDALTSKLGWQKE
jgi:NAD+ kinase